jgi:uncharacterized membrane protein required for colicin V production
MSNFNKILIGVWACLAIMSFVCAFFCPLFPKIIGLAFGAINMITILTVVIAFLQQIYYKNKLEKELQDVQLQESQTKPNKE